MHLAVTCCRAAREYVQPSRAFTRCVVLHLNSFGCSEVCSVAHECIYSAAMWCVLLHKNICICHGVCNAAHEYILLLQGV
jgi:hypothetical protein